MRRSCAALAFVGLPAVHVQCFMSTSIQLHHSHFVRGPVRHQRSACRTRRVAYQRAQLVAQLSVNFEEEDEEEEARNQLPKSQSEESGIPQPREGGLALNYRSDNGTRNSEFQLDDELEGKNQYFDVVRTLSPSELIGRFMKSSPPKVQEAVKTTVLGLLGSLPQHAIATTALATGGALANLMFQLQMTGYMFKNAEYRMALHTSLKSAERRYAGLDRINKLALDGGDSESGGSNDGSSTDLSSPRSGVHESEFLDEAEEQEGLEDDGYFIMPKAKIKGRIKLEMQGQEITVDADAYLSELTNQVDRLQKKLLSLEKAKEQAVNENVLMYIKTLPSEQIQSLSANMSPEVMESMKLLVDTVMRSMGGSDIGPLTITQQTGQGMAQLCMWQLVVGYNLREMEAREEMRKRYEAAGVDD